MLIGKFNFIQKRINKPGIPKNVEIRKKYPHPTNSTKKPPGDDNTVLAIPIIEESKAYWVPVYFLLHKTDKYATKAAEPRPPDKFSPAIVKMR